MAFGSNASFSVEVRVGQCTYGLAAKFPQSWWTCSVWRHMQHVWELEKLRASHPYKRLLLLLDLFFVSCKDAKPQQLLFLASGIERKDQRMDGSIYISSTWSREHGSHVKFVMPITLLAYERSHPHTKAWCLSFYFSRKWELLWSFSSFLASGWILLFAGVDSFQRERKPSSLYYSSPEGASAGPFKCQVPMWWPAFPELAAFWTLVFW